jgi:pyruvate/2-oxoglutarate dehydrogenase complex dihydrolipoamide acyltransferase (E2) component
VGKKLRSWITLSFDHRSINGGGRLLKPVIGLLEDPKKL